MTNDEREEDHPNKRNPEGGRFYAWLLPAAALILSIWLFFPILFRSEQFIYRDATDFYYPLWERIQEELNAGRAPLWDPSENLGQPLLANPTSAVYYPGKLIFFLTRIFPNSYGFCFKWFLLLHYAFALAGMYRLARRFGRSPTASTIAALAYGFSGPVFIQYCNPIFLIGASLLPWAILAGERLLREKSFAAVGGLAIVLALTVLGGDPQTAYLTGLLLVGFLIVQKRTGLLPAPVDTVTESRSKKKKRVKPTWREYFEKRPARMALALLAAAGLFGGLLSAAAILPARVMERNCDRSVTFAPNSIWEIPSFLAKYRQLNNVGGVSPDALETIRGRSAGSWIADGLFCREANGADSMARYRFSVHPFQLAELLWPHIDGNMLREEMWLDKMFPELQYWTVTLSFGVLPFLFALFSLRFRRRKTREGERDFDRGANLWLSSIFLLGLFASLGAYGLEWFLRNGWNLLIGEPLTGYAYGDPVGGVYWFFVVFLPKFASFRYPAKFLTLAVFAGSLLAAYGVDSIIDSKKLRRAALALAVVSVAAALLVGPCTAGYFQTLAAASPPPTFDAEGILSHLRFTFWGTAALLGCFVLFSTFRRRLDPRLRAALLIALIAVDLALVNVGALPTLPDRTVHRPSAAAETLLADGGPAPPRLYDGIGGRVPNALLAAVPPRRRIAETALWKNELFQEKRHYLSGAALYPFRGTMEPAGNAVLDFWIETQLKVGGPFHQAVGDLLGLLDIPYAIVPTAEAGRYSGYAAIPDVPLPDGTSLLKRQTASKRVFISRAAPPNPRIDRPEVFRANLRREAADLTPNESVRLESYRPNELVFSVRLEKPSDIWLSEQQWPGWKAEAVRVNGEPERRTLEIRPDPLFQTMRVVTLPAGEWRVRMVYRPGEVLFGLLISFASAAAFLFAALYRRRRK